MYKLIMHAASGLKIVMPDEVRIFGEAMRRVNLYKRKNKTAHYMVLNEDGVILYEK